MSAPTINPVTKRGVSLEVIDLYTQQAAALGAHRSAEIAGLLLASVDTFFVGDRDWEADTPLRDELMADKIEEAFEIIRDLPCLCSPEHGVCHRCAVIGAEPSHVDEMTSEVRAAWIVAQALVDLGVFTSAKDAHHAASTITFALWSAGKLAIDGVAARTA